MKTTYVRFIGKGQSPKTPEYLKGGNAECIWGQEIDKIDVVTVQLAKTILADGEKVANEKFGFIHEFYKIEVEINRGKKITYNSETNTLVVWVDSMPVYQNCNGVICRDSVALADCML